MQCDEDCRTAGFGKTERPVGWEGDGELSRVKLVRHCERGKPAGTDRLHLQALSHSFTLDMAEQAAETDSPYDFVQLANVALLANSAEMTRALDATFGGSWKKKYTELWPKYG